MVKKKEVNSSKVDLTEVKVDGAQQPGKISEFFYHMAAYGAFNYQKGIITSMKDPMIFHPTISISYLNEEVNKLAGYNLFYWLGRIQGRMGTLILLKKYGLANKDFQKLLDGASLDGWGKPLLIGKLDNVEAEINDTYIKLENPTVAIEYKKNNKIVKNSADNYILGEIVGGAEILLNYNLTAEEVSCISKKEKECIFKFKILKNPEEISEKSIDMKEYKRNIEKLMYNRNYKFKLISERDVKYGNGSFEFKGIKGILMLNYVRCLMDYICFNKDIKKYITILDQEAKMISEILLSIKYNNINDLLKRIEILGYGSLKLKSSSGVNKIIVENIDSPYTADFIYLFKKVRLNHYFLISLLKYSFQKNFNNNFKVTETACKLNGKNSCLFEISKLKSI